MPGLSIVGSSGWDIQDHLFVKTPPPPFLSLPTASLYIYPGSCGLWTPYCPFASGPAKAYRRSLHIPLVTLLHIPQDTLLFSLYPHTHSNKRTRPEIKLKQNEIHDCNCSDAVCIVCCCSERELLLSQAPTLHLLYMVYLLLVGVWYLSVMV